VLATSCGCGPTTLYLVTRPAGRTFGRPKLVSRTATDAQDFGALVRPVVAMNERGDVLVVWQSFRAPQQGILQARIQRDGRWRAAPQTLGPMLDMGALSARIGRGGRAVVAWGTMPASTGGGGSGPLGPATYLLSTAGRDGRFSPGRVLDRGSARDSPVPGIPIVVPSTPQIAADMHPSGQAVVTWTAAEGERPVVRATEVDGSAVEPAQTLGEGALGAVAVGPRRASMVLWYPADLSVAASTARAGAPFAAPEQIAPPGTVGSGSERAALAFDPRTRRAIAAWSGHYGASGEPSRAGYAVREPVG
jgi:hypothetical protein